VNHIDYKNDENADSNLLIASITNIIISLMVSFKIIYFPFSLKNVRIWLESKTPNELKKNLAKFKKFKIILIVLFFFIILINLSILFLSKSDIINDITKYFSFFLSLLFNGLIF
jgi:hypothetical protein